MNNQPHDLPALFRTPERVTLLSIALTRHACTVQQVAGKTGISKGLASQYLALLEREGLLARRDDRTYRVIPSARTAAIKRILNIDRVMAFFKKPAWALGIGMYGSWAEGTNTEESDLDLWVFVQEPPAGTAVAETERTVSRALSVEVHLLVITREKIDGMKKNDEPFYRLFSRQSITLDGESPEAA
ncbi:MULTISPECIES: nucleotidyltransferase domain-containing protein [unclassified Methanoregula]|uniref:nucleotidyltransferase domain-containing protein n=1 Tax=unclassified Methanoregula TaxID=2649730 RepID=UPI0009D4C95B|nr:MULTISPECIES: nucleotidyltransferase domain-containing protein [unclassified Methanoregula]OPX65352.1 MAG: Nucleotidyltransferase domain protein [Methanoregula sp. PtaB.Bin085]OPY32261.1 MAG: Nucleotidyltransferase domain protein [Methanoregula sp. PtaU1.Bin006]